jgi:ABC-type transport system substrate-binding protein
VFIGGSGFDKTTARGFVSSVTVRARSAAMVLLGTLLAGCTNDPYPQEDPGAKVLYLSYPIPPKTLDPAVAYSNYDQPITGNVFDTLLQYHYLERPYRLIPSLAAEVPSGRVQADGRVAYRFTLRPGLLFQEDECFARVGGGRTRSVLAADVAFELARLADPDVDSPVIDTFGRLEGFREFAERLRALRASDAEFAALRIDRQYARAGGIAGVRVLSDTELEIVVREPYPQILYWFAMPFTTPLPWEAVVYYDGRDGRANLADHPVGTGPFRLLRYDRRSRIVLERNPTWYGSLHPEWQAPGAVYPDGGAAAEATDTAHGAVAGRTLPFVDRVEFRRDAESVPAYIKFMQGYYDQSIIIRESFDRAVQHGALTPAMTARGLQLAKTVLAAVYYLGFNMDDAVVGSAAGERGRGLRQAMSLAIDSDEFLRLFFNDRGIEAQSPVPPDIFGYDPAYRNPYRIVDLPRAAALLRTAGYDNGIDPQSGRPLHLSLDVNDTSARSLLMFQFFRDSWKRLGLDVEITATDYNAFQDKMRTGAYQLFWWGWGADYPDPENFLFLLYGPMGRTRSGGPNTANFADPAYDALFVRVRALDNGPERAALIADMRSILERERPWIEIFHPEDYTLSHGWVQHAKPSALTLPTEKYLDVDPAGRAQLRRAWNRPVRWPAYLLLAGAAAFIAPAIRRRWRDERS